MRPDLPEIYCADGLRADGWMELAGSGGRLAIATRENWQNHPKSLRADAATGRFTVSLYPERAEPLDLRRYSDTAYAHTYESPCTWDFSTVPFPFTDPALGIRKTHDLALYVGEENPSARTLFLNQPPMLNWTPSYLARCKTVVPATGKEHAGWRQVLDGYITFLQREMQASGGTGYINYFDLPHGFDEAQGRWFHDFGGFGYINDEAMPTLGLWQTWMTTQRPAVLSMARAMTRHNADIDSRHLGPRAGSGSRHNVNHWGCSCYERRISMPLGKRFAYHVSLDRSIVDLAQVTMASWVRDLSPGRGVNMTCDIPALIATLLFLEETGQHDGRRWLQALADGIAAGVDEQGRMVAMMHTDAALETAQPDHESGVISFMMFSGFGGPQAFAELAERYDHPGLRDALVRFARYQMLSAAERRQMEETDKVGVFSQDVNLFRALDLIAYAWQVTGERAFIDGMERMLSHCAVTVEQQAAPRYGVPTAGALTAPRFTRWPARPDEQERPKRNFYPLFTGYGTGHLFNMSVYLHKQQGLMAIATAAEQSTGK